MPLEGEPEGASPLGDSSRPLRHAALSRAEHRVEDLHRGDAVGDALATDRLDAVLSVWVGDCAAVAVVGDSGQFSLVHAGWRGALGGVVERSISMLRSMGAGECTAFLLSAIGPCCYEFGADDLRTLIDRYGAAVACALRG